MLVQSHAMEGSGTYSINNADDKQKLIQDETEKGRNLPRQCCYCRYLLASLLSLGYGIIMMQRSSFNIALVAMVNFTKSDEVTNISTDTCPQNRIQGNHTPTHPKEGEFVWDESQQSLLLAAFYYGYIVLQIPGGYLADRCSAKLMILVSVLAPSMFTLLVPVVARWNFTALVALRVVTGLLSGPMIPTMSSFIGRWIPVLERSKTMSLVNIGAALGMIASPYVTSVLCDSTFGWPSAFYLFGGLGCLWCIAAVIFIYDSPDTHPWISTRELTQIQNLTGTSRKAGQNQTLKIKTPWKSILTSVPVWANVFTSFCDSVGFYVIFSTFPLYLREILKFDVENNGLVNSAMNTGYVLMVLVAGILSDFIHKKKLISLTWNRKIATDICHGSLAVALVTIALSTCDQTVAVSALVIGYTLSATGSVGFNLNPIDLAPRYAGFIMGMCNTAGNVGGFLSPEVVGVITKNDPGFRGWRTAFLLAAGVYSASVVNFTLFSTGAQQPWAEPAPVTEDLVVNADPTEGPDPHQRAS